MAKKNKELEQQDDGGTDEQPESGSVTTSSGRTSFEEKMEEKELRLQNVDRDKIDQIILSNDVNKGGKIRVERKGPLDREYQFITYIAAEQWNTEESLEYLKKMYGGGDYKCMTFRANGQMYKPFSFSIDYRMKGALDEDQIKRMADSKSGPTMIMPPNDNGFKSSDLIKVMEMSNGKSETMLTLMMTMMMESQKTMATVLAAALTRGSSSGEAKGIDPVIVELLRAKQEKTPVMELVEMMTAIKALNEPPEEKEETMFDKILKLAPAIIPALSGGSMMPAPAPTALPPAPPSSPGQPQQQPAATGGMIDQMPKAMKIMLFSMLKAAERGSDPALYADIIIDNMADEPSKWQFLRGILTDERWLVKLFGDEARVAHIKPWLEELRVLLLNYDPAAPAESGQPEQPLPAEGSSSPAQ